MGTLPPIFPRYDYCIVHDGSLVTVEVWDLLERRIVHEFVRSTLPQKYSGHWPSWQMHVWPLEHIEGWAIDAAVTRNAQYLREWTRAHR